MSSCKERSLQPIVTAIWVERTAAVARPSCTAMWKSQRPYCRVVWLTVADGFPEVRATAMLEMVKLHQACKQHQGING